MAQVKFNARLGLSVGSTPTDVLDSSGNLLITVPVSAGGTGTTTPALVQGTNVTITGTWPNQTINAAGGGGAWSTISGRSGAEGPLDVLVGFNTNDSQPSLGTKRVALGYQAGAATQQDYAIAIGDNAGNINQAPNAIAIGQLAGSTSQGDTAIAIGHQSGTTSQATHGISIGYYAGHTTQSQYAVAVGYGAGNVVQGANAVSVGSQAGEQNQAANAVALGNIAGNSSQGANSVAIGAYAGQTNQAANSIVLSATGTELNAASTGFFVAPIRDTVTPVGTKYTLTWDATTKEITGTTSGGVDLWKYKTAAYTAITGDKILANTTGGTFIITLPATPVAGNTVTIGDGGDWSTTNLTVARNGSTVEGVTDNISFNLKGANVTLVYDGTTWQVFSTGAASLPLSGLTDATITSPTTNQVLQWNGTKWVNATVAAGGVTSFSGSTTGLTPSTATTGAIVLAGTLAVANGGTGTTTPALVQGTNITITGTWPNQTINAAGGGGGLTTTDDVATNASYYPIVATTAGGSTAKTASTKFAFNPSTGSLSATNFISLSDKNFKNNITTITPSKGLEVVNSLNAVSFNWKDNDDKAYGIIAQEIEEILPEIVTTDEFGIKKVAYNQIIPFLLSAVKALSEEVNALKGR
jgi:hypothetical protein